MKILELFSGIGGMHYAAKDAGLDCQIVAAIDICDLANRFYNHNFPGVKNLRKNICGLTSQQVNQWEPEMLLMSPPCQPFSRQGYQKDINDPRTSPLLHILDLLPNLTSLQYILIENVKGFDESLAREATVSVLTKCGFQFQEFLISPSTHLGIPNSRLRYYLIATRRKNHEWKPVLGLERSSFTMRQIGEYLEKLPDSVDLDLRVPDSILLKRASVMDVVSKESTHSCCFTKAYGRYVEGTGSVIQQAGNIEDVFKLISADSDDAIAALKELNLRYFSPREISNLLGFPADPLFKFPNKVSKRDCYRVLGNSLNVKVVAKLIKLLVFN